MNNPNRLKSILQRINDSDQAEIDQRKDFVDLLRMIKIAKRAKALSVSAGDGVWDYLVTKYNKNINHIISTDIVSCPVRGNDIKMLMRSVDWKFIKLKPETELPFNKSQFDLVFHCDVIEHVQKPYLFLSEQYRVLKKGGYLLLDTPNLLRPANLAKLLIGKLDFPNNLGNRNTIGSYIHIEEFTSWQLKILLEEVGFKILEVRYSYFGIYPLNIRLSKFPGRGTQQMAHYITILAQK